MAELDRGLYAAGERSRADTTPDCHSASNFDPQPWPTKLLNLNGNQAHRLSHGWTAIKFMRAAQILSLWLDGDVLIWVGSKFYAEFTPYHASVR